VPVPSATREPGSACGGALTRAAARVLPSSRLGPDASHLPDGGVEPVEDVGRGDSQQQHGQSFLVVVPGGLVPDLVRYWIRPVGQPGDSLGQGQRRTLSAWMACMASGMIPAGFFIRACIVRSSPGVVIDQERRETSPVDPAGSRRYPV
jgi:hypothetical protein